MRITEELIGEPISPWHAKTGEAAAKIRNIIARGPGRIKALTSSKAYRRLKEHEQIMQLLEENVRGYSEILDVDPLNVFALSQLGITFEQLGRWEEATRVFDQCLCITPTEGMAHVNRAMLAFRLGDYQTGWKELEWRKYTKSATARLHPKKLLWLGKEDISGKTLLLHYEQGFGDSIQFARYVPIAARKSGATIVLEVQKGLGDLFAASRLGVAQIIERPSPLPDFDYHTPLMSLPLALEEHLQSSIPAEAPYLSPPEVARAKWLERVPDHGRLKVGIAWASVTGHMPQRHIPLGQLARIFELPCDFHVVQKVISKSDLEILKGSHLNRRGARASVSLHTEELNDFSDTAALMSRLDLVVSIDSCTAHLAGALGKPVWILLPWWMDWRWTYPGAFSSWYPSARRFQQLKINRWHSVIDQVTQELRKTVRNGS